MVYEKLNKSKYLVGIAAFAILFLVAACATAPAQQTANTAGDTMAGKGDSMMDDSMQDGSIAGDTDAMMDNGDMANHDSASDGSMAKEDDSMMDDKDSMAGNVKTFVLTGENFKFVMDGEDNPTLTVNEGDTVRIEFSSIDGFHDWVVDEFDAATAKVWAPNSTYVEFVAGKKGTFEYYCSVGQHRQMGMKGNLVVE